MKPIWKKGRGKLDPLKPLIGRWVAEADSPMGKLRCTREIEEFGDSYLRLTAHWQFGAAKKAGKGYREIAMIGVGEDGIVSFWSFTSDGKKSQGKLCDASDVHAEAIGFEAQMPAGLARMVYWPDDDGRGFFWVVESKTKKGWNRFVTHHYLPA